MSTSTAIPEQTKASTLTKTDDHRDASEKASEDVASVSGDDGARKTQESTAKPSCEITDEITDDVTAPGTEAEAALTADVPAEAAARGGRGGRGGSGRRGRRLGVIALFSLMLPAAMLAVVAFVLSGRAIQAPEWARAHVEAYIDQQMADFEVTIDAIALRVEQNWDPSIQLRGVHVLPNGASTPVNVSEVEARMDYAPLLEGQLALKDVRLRGVTLSALRQEDGVVQIAIGQTAGDGGLQAETQAVTIGEQVEAYLSMPVLAQLQVFRIEDVTLRFEDLRERRAWSVDGGQMALVRDGERVELSAQLTLLGGRSYASTIEASLVTQFGTREVEFGLNFEDLPSEDIASQLVSLRWLEILRAPISGAVRGRIDEAGNLGNVNATLQVSDGFVQPGGEVRPVPFHEMRSYLTYDPERGAIRFDELSVDSDLMRVAASGEAVLRDFQSGVPQEFLVQLTLNEFRASPGGLLGDPIRLERSFADFRLRLDPFEVDLGQLVVRREGSQIVLDGRLGADGANWDYAVNGHLDSVRVQEVLSLWPDGFEPKLNTWLTENVISAHVHNVDVAVRSDNTVVPDIFVSFLYDDTDLRALKTMPPIIGGRGFGVFQEHQLHITVEEGYVAADEGGLVDVSGSTFSVLNTRLKQSPALVKAKARGTTTAAMSLLDREPLRLFTKANLPVDFAPGQAVAEGEVSFILKDKLPIEEVHYDARAQVRDVVSDHFLPGREMRGNFEVHARPERVDVRGGGTLAGLPVTAHWYALIGPEHTGKSRLEGTAELSAQALEVFEIGLPAGTIRDRATMRYGMDIVEGAPPKLQVESDLVGARLFAAPLAWSKGAQAAGVLELDVTLTELPTVERFVFDAPGLSARGDITLSEAGGVNRIQLEEFAVGSWLRGTGQLRGRGATASPEVILNSGRLDMRRMPDFGASAASQDNGPITARLNEVIVTDSIRLSPASAELTTPGGAVAGSFSGNFNGGPFVRGQVTPHPNGSRVLVQSEQGGQMAMQMGVLDAATQGALSLDLVPRATEGSYDGTLTVKDLRVQSVPAIASLLNAISIVGLVSQLDGPGIFFSEVFSKFRVTPQQLIIGEGSAVGPSIGVSANGTYDYVQETFDIQGTVSPIYAVNVVGRPLSRRGEGLIGFNYRMRGPAGDFRVSINPLSVLTPGFFREIFRRRPPDLSN